MTTSSIFSIQNATLFNEAAIETFRYQYEHVPIYRMYCDLLNSEPLKISDWRAIPFLPIEFFKSETILSSECNAEAIFSSSGTTGAQLSKHHIAQLDLYRESFETAFHQFYGDSKPYAILALLPSYLEREGSSLIYMVDHLIKASGSAHSGFYLNQIDALAEKLQELEKAEKPVLLLGVSYALLDLVEAYSLQLKNTIVMETGGMKGRRKELVKEELHEILCKGLGVSKIHSEYGMTELLSQAYSRGDGIYRTPSWMKVCTRDTEDPLTLVEGKTGGMNVVDLANRYSCSFIATQDLGKVHPDGSFEILGRFDTSDIRGCNLMVL